MKGVNAVAITGQTLMGVNTKGPYPLKFGNHFSVLADDGKDYFIRNFRLENLRHLLKGTIEFPIKISVLSKNEANIDDKRIPDDYYLYK